MSVKSSEHFGGTPDTKIRIQIDVTQLKDEEAVSIDETVGALLNSQGTMDSDGSIEPRVMLYGTADEVSALLGGIFISLFQTYGVALASAIHQTASLYLHSAMADDLPPAPAAPDAEAPDPSFN
jgi:hypothetical protein